MCFNRAFSGYTVPLNGETISSFSGMYCVAPYFADLYSTVSGKVWYQIYDTTTDSTLNNHQAVTRAEGLVFNRYGINFDAVLVIKATWDAMPAGSLQEVWLLF